MDSKFEGNVLKCTYPKRMLLAHYGVNFGFGRTFYLCQKFSIGFEQKLPHVKEVQKKNGAIIPHNQQKYDCFNIRIKTKSALCISHLGL